MQPRRLCSTSLGATRPCASRSCVDSCTPSCTRPLAKGPNTKTTDPSLRARTARSLRMTRRVGFIISLRGASEPVILSAEGAKDLLRSPFQHPPWSLPLAPGGEPDGAQVGEPGKRRLQAVRSQAGLTRPLGQRPPPVGELDHAR